MGALVTNFEFDFDNSVTAGNLGISLTNDDTQQEIADKIVTALQIGVPSLFPRTVPGRPGLIDFGGTPSHTLDTSGTANLTQNGLVGGATPRVPVAFAPTSSFLASDVAQAVEQAINVTTNNLALSLDILAIVSQFGGRSLSERFVQLVHTSGFPSDITYTPVDFALGTVPPPLSVQVTNDVVKQDEDLLRMIGHTVQDPGPVGLDRALPGDPFGVFHESDPAPRGQNNNHEGLYIDDIIIGFAERGEMATDSSTNSSFVANPLLRGNQIHNGPYQLEIRKGADFGIPLFRSFDTNDRLSEGITLVAHAGANIYDGQTFVISDGVNSVVFEYDDQTIGDGVQEGRQPVPFRPDDTAYDVAKSVRDTINSSSVQAVLSRDFRRFGRRNVAGIRQSHLEHDGSGESLRTDAPDRTRRGTCWKRTTCCSRPRKRTFKDGIHRPSSVLVSLATIHVIRCRPVATWISSKSTCSVAKR